MTVVTVVVSVVTCTVIDNRVGDEVWVSLEFVGDFLDTMYHSLQHNSVDFFPFRVTTILVCPVYAFSQFKSHRCTTNVLKLRESLRYQGVNRNKK
jgi:hypothetical protein